MNEDATGKRTKMPLLVEPFTGATVGWLLDQWVLLLLACMALVSLSLLLYSKRTAFSEKNEVGTLSLLSLAKTANRRHCMNCLMKVLAKPPKNLNTLQEPSTGLNLFLCSCLSGQRKLIEYLLLKGADINSTSSDGDTAVILATYACCTVRGADPAIIDLLACRGVDVNARNNSGDTPLSIAALYGRSELLSILLQYGADVNVPGNGGCLPVDFAEHCGSQESVKVLNTQKL